MTLPIETSIANCYHGGMNSVRFQLSVKFHNRVVTLRGPIHDGSRRTAMRLKASPGLPPPPHPHVKRPDRSTKVCQSHPTHYAQCFGRCTLKSQLFLLQVGKEQSAEHTMCTVQRLGQPFNPLHTAIEVFSACPLSCGAE